MLEDGKVLPEGRIYEVSLDILELANIVRSINNEQF